MKTYQQYLRIIKDRELEEQRLIESQYQGTTYGTGSLNIPVDANVRMSFDYSVEIMGMMMQDFLKELSDHAFQFDETGRLKVVTEKESGI